MHWTRQEITVHTGTVKFHKENVYYVYLSDNQIQDQAFANITQVIDSTDFVIILN